MFRIIAILILAVVVAAPAFAALMIVGDPLMGKPGEMGTLWIRADTSWPYIVWLEVQDLSVASIADTWSPWCPEVWIPEAPDCPCDCWHSGGVAPWCLCTVVSNNPSKPLTPGDQVKIDILYRNKGNTVLNVYAEDGTTKLDNAEIIVIPEPGTVVLLGMGAWFMRRRRRGNPA